MLRICEKVLRCSSVAAISSDSLSIFAKFIFKRDIAATLLQRRKVLTFTKHLAKIFGVICNVAATLPQHYMLKKNFRNVAATLLQHYKRSDINVTLCDVAAMLRVSWDRTCY